MDVKRLLTKIRPIFARFNPQGSASSPAIRNEKLPRQSGLSEPCETSVSARPPSQGSGAWCEGRHGADARQSAESVLWCTALLWEAGGDSSEPRTRLGLVRASLLLLWEAGAPSAETHRSVNRRKRSPVELGYGNTGTR